MQPQVFQVIKDYIAEGGEAATVIEKATVDALTSLMAIDSQATSELILSSFTHHHTTLLDRLQNHPPLLYQYLHAIITAQRRPGHEGEKGGLCLSPKLHEKYFTLMCKYSPESVLDYLQASDSLVSLEQCLSLCKSHNLTDATVYLLERTGDLSGALDLILHDLEANLSDLSKAYAEEEEPGAVPAAGEFYTLAYTARGDFFIALAYIRPFIFIRAHTRFHRKHRASDIASCNSFM